MGPHHADVRKSHGRHRAAQRSNTPAAIGWVVAAGALLAVVPNPNAAPVVVTASALPAPEGAIPTTDITAIVPSGIRGMSWMDRSLDTVDRADRARSIAEIDSITPPVTGDQQPPPDTQSIATEAAEPTGQPAALAPVATAPFAAPTAAATPILIATPTPVAAPAPPYVLPATGRYTSCFCERWGESHGGIDLANTSGTPELAAATGSVIVAGPASGFGQWIQILHDDGTVTVYGHMDTIEVHVGQQVVAGQLIATMGAQGNSTGPHLHFEVWPSGDRTQRVDPAVWLTERGVQLPEYTP